MNRSVFAGLVAVVALLAVVGTLGTVVAIDSVDGNAAPAGSETEPSAEALAVSSVNDQQFDRTFFEITVHENGSATWTFRHERTLETDDGGDDVEAFETFAEEFESEETDLYQRFTRQAEGLTETGAERTDREMEASNFNRSAEVDHQIRGEVGVVEMTFQWDGFADANEEEGTVVVGDVFDGLYLESNQHLIVEAGDDLSFASAQPEGEYSTVSLENADSITYRGDQEFIEGQPRVVLEHDEAGGSGAPVDSPALVVATLLVVTLAIAGAFAWRRTGGRPTEAIGSVTGADMSPDEAAPGTDDDALSGDELLTDEDRVVKLIRENGGRMKQVDIVEETGWSKSKVSMLLSEMESEGTISKLRVGRENIISLEGFEPEATKSPFEE